MAGPVLIWSMFKFLYSKYIPLFQIICLYGYSMSCFIIITPFCIIQYDVQLYFIYELENLVTDVILWDGQFYILFSEKYIINK